MREYIWLNDIPVAVVDQVNTSPVVYYVHTDHLGRPARMTAANWSWAWDVIYSPFGAVSYIWTNPEVMDARFPGQWFQLETGLAYNWNRHYDPTLGRYIQPDPFKNDDGNMSVNGISTSMIGVKLSVGNGEAIADAFGRVAPDAFVTQIASVSARAMLQDGPSVYNYARQSPLVKTDPSGLQPNDKLYGLQKKFWNWYHRFEKLDGAPDLNKDDACQLYDDWCAAGCPMRPL